jgi:hypothetical protein
MGYRIIMQWVGCDWYAQALCCWRKSGLLAVLCTQMDFGPIAVLYNHWGVLYTRINFNLIADLYNHEKV